MTIFFRVPITSTPSPEIIEESISIVAPTVTSVTSPVSPASSSQNVTRSAVNTPNKVAPTQRELQHLTDIVVEENIEQLNEKDVELLYEERKDVGYEVESESSGGTTMFILEVITYVIAVICGIILNLLIIKVCAFIFSLS